tara:strand:- start:392 stop:517 length:126 start_codon:yes stop_codon:yes gene_type:complete
MPLQDFDLQIGDPDAENVGIKIWRETKTAVMKNNRTLILLI